MLKRVAIALVVLIAALLGFAATRPDSFRIERMTNIKAPPEKIFGQIVDFHNWGAWSPWEKMDPDMKRMHSGAPMGKGAAYAWDGNSKVGKGKMEITDATPSSKVAVKLDFEKPFEGHNIAEFTLTPKGETTDVSWVMHGPSPFIAKVMGIFFSMDSMIGKDFEAGLANMKSVAEK